jgi:small subunit ribosomal protein S2
MAQPLELKALLNAGAHFGHQTHKWNPKMKRYVYGERNGIYVIDLGQTIPLAKKASEFLEKVRSEGNSVLFVGTKRQASQVVRDAADSCGAYHVTHRWLGGMLTNFKTISQSIDKIRKVEKMRENGDFSLLTKKEQIKVNKDIIKLERSLGGIKNMRKLPGAVFIIDPNIERTAVKEANKLGIPVVAITDTNCDPEGIDYVVPGNDDAIKSIKLFLDYFSNSLSKGSLKSKNKEDGSSDAKDVDLEQEILKKYEADIDLKDDTEDVVE